ncbi:hypothetical protein ACU4GI_21960 [Cupriavidus basilensis]
MRSIRTAAVMAVLYSLTSRAALLLVNIISVKLMASHDYGIFSYVNSCIISVAALSILGFGVTANTYVAKHIKSDRDAAVKIVRSSFLLVTTLAIVCGILVTPFILRSLPELAVSNVVIATFFAAFTIWLFSIGGVIEGALYGAEKYRSLFNNGVISLIVTPPVTYVLIDRFGVIGALISISIYKSILVSLNFVSAHRCRILELRFDFREAFSKSMRQIILKFTIPAAASALIVAPVITICLALVKSHSSDMSRIGAFSWVYQIYSVAIFVPAALGPFFVSRLAKSGGGISSLKSILRFNFIFSIVAAMIMLIGKPFALNALGNPVPEYAVSIYNAMSACIVLYSINAAFSSFWPSMARNWIGLSCNGLWSVLIIVTTWLLASNLGAFAIALAMAMAYSVTFFLQFWLALKLNGSAQ